ncbi:MAG: hypothetical protein ACYCW6_24250, partial [Candidatus Xenobia bacterium]
LERLVDVMGRLEQRLEAIEKKLPAAGGTPPVVRLDEEHMVRMLDTLNQAARERGYPSISAVPEPIPEGNP